MAEDPPYVPVGAEEPESDVLGKLDNLINKHKPRARDDAEGLPVLTEALVTPPDDGIPTLTDIVAPGQRPATAESRALEDALVQGLAVQLEAQRARLAAAGGNADRVALIDTVVAQLRQALPDIVRTALDRQQRR